MRFNFALSVDAQAGDQLDDLRDQLQAAGHEFRVTRGTLAPPPWFNLVGEGTSELTPERLIPLMRAGYQVIALVTEEPTLVTAEGLVWNHSVNETWSRRADAFVEMAPHFTAAWCYAPGAAAALRRWIPRAADIDMAWGRRFEAIRPTIRPVHDFCFFGGMTRRRGAVLDDFMRRGHSVDVISHGSTLADRDARIPLSKVVLDVKQTHWWKLVSSVRYVTALLAHRPVVAEARSADAKDGWKDVVRFAPDDESFRATALEVLHRWQHQAERQRALLRAKRSLIPEAVALLPEPRASTAPEVSLPAYQPPELNGHRAEPPRLVRSSRGINFVEWGDEVYVVPQSLGTVLLDRPEWRKHSSIRKFSNLTTALRAMGE